MSYASLRPLFFALDPERAHTFSIAALELLGRMPNTRARVARCYGGQDARLAQNLWGLHFPNPVGLAAGYDKDGRAVAALPALGFGFIEIGTITPRPQPGNPKPRVFRYPGAEAVINRMGFPSEGAHAVARRLAALETHPVPLGINLGKNKDTPLERAHEDYIAALEVLFPYGDYLVINVSSPNTPGLRLLQGVEALRDLLSAIRAANGRLAALHRRQSLPVLLKIAPDLAAGDLEAIGALALETGGGHLVDGFVATNTTIDRSGFPQGRDVTGGLSGAPLKARTTEVVRSLYRATGGRVPIVGVGGIACAQDAYEKIRAGASLVQVYTGLIYRGPALVGQILRDLPALWERDGFGSLGEARGR